MDSPPQALRNSISDPVVSGACIRISGLYSTLPWPSCSSRSRGQAFKRSRRSSLLSALFRCRSRLFRRYRFTTRTHHVIVQSRRKGRPCVMPVTAEAPLMAPHLPTAAPHAVKRQPAPTTSVSGNGDRSCRP